MKKRLPEIFGIGLLVLFLILAAFLAVRVQRGRDSSGSPSDSVPSSQVPVTAPKNIEEIRERERQRLWNPEIQRISATVMDVNPAESQLQLMFTWPPSAPAYNTTQWVKILCSFEETEVYSKGTSPTLENEGRRLVGRDVFAPVQKNFFFTGFCADPQCQSVGKGCRLYE